MRLHTCVHTCTYVIDMRDVDARAPCPNLSFGKKGGASSLNNRFDRAFLFLFVIGRRKLQPCENLENTCSSCGGALRSSMLNPMGFR